MICLFSRNAVSLTAVFSFCLAPLLYADETISMVTYYPAPFGTYDRLKLAPRDSIVDPDACDEAEDVGLMYYDNGHGVRPEGLYICQKTSNTNANQFEWVFVSRPVKPAPPAPGNAKVVCLKTDGKFGLCADNPSADGTCQCE